MSSPFWLAVALAIGRSCAFSGSQIDSQFCTWGQARVGTIRDTVFLDGGTVWWNSTYEFGNPLIADISDGTLWYLNFSTTFDTTTTNLSSLFGTMPKTPGGTGNNIAPPYTDGALLANDYMFWLYGGLPTNTDAYNFPPGGQDILGYEEYQANDAPVWEPGFGYASPGNVTRFVTNGAGVSAPSENRGFYFSGAHAPGWGPIYNGDSIPGAAQTMIEVDFSGEWNSEWTNSTLPSYVRARANAEAVWVPVSDSGALVVVGGVIYPESLAEFGILTANQTQQSRQISPTFMETVSVYDIASGQWYLQETSGDIPPQLTEFCSVYASASDGSSHNIYIYGGYSGLSPDDAPIDDVYVLSLPSFVWIKLYSGVSSHGRKSHKCVKPYPDKMLVLGGMGSARTDCVEVIQVFNLNTGEFQNTYDPTEWSEYQVPSLVSAQIGGDPNGAATQTVPESWTNESLADVFSTKYTKTIATWYPYNATITPTVIPSATPEPQGSSFPAWAGAIIGVLLGLLLFTSALVFWLLRRRKKNGRSRRTSEVSGSRGHRIMQWMQMAGDPAKDTIETVSSTGYNDHIVPIPPSTITETQSNPVYEMPLNASNGPPPAPTQPNLYPPPLQLRPSPAQQAAFNTFPPVELPTDHNQPYLTSAPRSPQVAYVSPVSPDIPEPEDGDTNSSSARPGHQRNVSSLSTIPVLPSGTVPEDEEAQDPLQRPRVTSGVSEISVSSDGTRVEFTARNSHSQGLEDIHEPR